MVCPHRNWEKSKVTPGGSPSGKKGKKREVKTSQVGHSMRNVGKYIWVVCPHDEFAFLCEAGYLWPEKVVDPSPTAQEMYLRCPKCRKTFFLRESKIPVGAMPRRIPDTLDEAP